MEILISTVFITIILLYIKYSPVIDIIQNEKNSYLILLWYSVYKNNNEQRKFKIIYRYEQR